MMKNKRIKLKTYFELKELLVIIIAFVVVTASITGYGVYWFIYGKAESNSYLNDIIKSYNKIKSDYYESLNEEELSSSAINGMMKYLNETYSEYLNDSDTDSLNEKLNGKYKGIGIRITNADNIISVYEVFEDSPAKKAGLKEGDIFTEVNGKKVSEMTINDITESIQKSEKTVTIKAKRDEEELTFKIQVTELDVPVSYARIQDEDNKIGYISLNNFSSSSYKQFNNNLINLEKKGIKSLIIDLRDNTGGYLKDAESIASLFVKKGKILYYLDNKKQKEKILDKTKEERDYPVVILVNNGTASASEVLAASLKENAGAILVGEKTYGKGKVQQTSKLSDNQSIKYTTAKWYTPNGDCIDGIGLKPGIEIVLSKEYYSNPVLENDNQLNKAVSILKSYSEN